MLVFREKTTREPKGLEMKLGLFFILFFPGQTFADTVNIDDLPDNPIESIQFRCARYDECQESTENIFAVAKGQSYQDANGVTQVAAQNGYYVGSQDDLDDSTLVNGFFSGKQYDDSPDGKFYICEPGKNVVIENVPMEDLLNPHPQIQLPPLDCPSLWVPKSYEPPFDEPSGGGDYGTGTGTGTGIGGGGNGYTVGGWNGGFGISGGGGGGYDDDDDFDTDDDDDDGASGGNGSGGATNGGTDSGGGSNGEQPPAPVPLSSSFWNSAVGIIILLLISLFAS